MSKLRPRDYTLALSAMGAVGAIYAVVVMISPHPETPLARLGFLTPFLVTMVAVVLVELHLYRTNKANAEDDGDCRWEKGLEELGKKDES